MSIEVMSCVWKRFPATGSELLAMLALADWCNEDGGSLYPSMKSVADKIRVSEKQARRIIRGFEAAGYLSVVGNAHGGAPGTTKQFRLNVKKLADLPLIASSTPPMGVTPPVSVTPPMGVRDPSHPASETPPTHGSQSTIEPSIEPPKKKAQAPSSFVLPEWINQSHWDAWHSCDKRKKTTDLQKQMAVEKLGQWREAGIDYAAALENAAIGGWQGLFKPDDKKAAAMTASNRQTESFAERDARNRREAWERMTGRQWPADELPGARPAAPMVIDIESNEIKRLSK